MMIARQRTQLLFLLTIASAVAAAAAWSALNTTRAHAEASQQDQAVCLTELSTIGVKASASDRSAVPDDMAINRRLRGAAVAAHLSDQLASIEPGVATRLPDTDVSQTPIYVRLNAVTLRQLVGLLYELSSADSTLRTSDIELSLPLAAPASHDSPAEVWTADVTLSYLSYAQPPSPER